MVVAPVVYPNAKIPTVELPAAAPEYDAELAAVPDDTTQPEYVYLSRVVDEPVVYPKANIAKVPVGAGVTLDVAALNADGPKTLVALTLNVYAVQLVKHATVMGDVVPVPVLKPGQETAV